jgi:hypothetical protein
MPENVAETQRIARRPAVQRVDTSTTRPPAFPARMKVQIQNPILLGFSIGLGIILAVTSAAGGVWLLTKILEVVPL